ncbi:MAG TPA: hypothetical protein VD789_07140 [Thermomicrobiales bacterium]|nr:hypothetical protein [Thermomicrobiales bacterium]
MAVITLLEFPGLTREQYERVGANLAGGPPEGILYHSCGPHEGGWRVVDIWESREAFDRFVDGTYLAAVRGVGGPEPSRREVVEANHAGAVLRG